MPAVVPIAAQLAASAVTSAIGLGGIASSLIVGGAAVLGGYIASHLFGKPKESNPDDLRANYVSTDKTIPVVYGKRLIGSNDVFVEIGTNGGFGSSGKYLWIVHALCEGEIEGINQIEVDGDMQYEIYINSTPIWEFKSGKVEWWFYNGSPTQTHNTYIEAGTDGKFNMAMRNTAYIVFRFKYGGKGEKAILGVPKREVVILGTRCYDTRTSLTDYTDNPVIILYNYMTNSVYGAGWDPSLIDTQSFEEAANYCDSHGPESDEYWKCNYAIADPVNCQSTIDSILGHFRGSLRWYNGKIYLSYMDLREEVPSFVIDDRHIARDSSGKAMVSMSQPSSNSTPDGAAIEYVNARNNWTSDRIHIGDTIRSNSNIATITFAGFTERNLALNMGTYVLERQRLNRIISLNLRTDTIAIDTNDLVKLTSKELGLEDTLIRVKSNNISGNGLIGITSVVESESLYNETFEPDNSDIYTISFPSITDPPPSVEGISVEEKIFSYRGRSLIQLRVSFDEPTKYPWFSCVAIYVYEQREGDDPPSSIEDYTTKGTATDDFTIDDVYEGCFYYIVLVTRSIHDVDQDFDSASRIGYKVIGVSKDHPECPTYFGITVGVTSIDVLSNELVSPDVASYEIRFGDSWLGGIFISSANSPTFSYNNVKPGLHTFWLNTKHTNGRYCLSPLYKLARIEEPPRGTHLFFGEVLNFNDGTATDLVISGSYPNQTVSVDHTGGNLVGSFVSDPIDTNNEHYPNFRMCVYALFGFDVDLGTGTWAGLLTPTTSWLTFLDGKRWSDLLVDAYTYDAAKIEVSVDVCLDDQFLPGTYDTYHRLELVSPVVYGIWIRLRITLIDINLDSTISMDAPILKAAYLEEALLVEA